MKNNNVQELNKD